MPTEVEVEPLSVRQLKDRRLARIGSVGKGVSYMAVGAGLLMAITAVNDHNAHDHTRQQQQTNKVQACWVEKDTEVICGTKAQALQFATSEQTFRPDQAKAVQAAIDGQITIGNTTYHVPMPQCQEDEVMYPRDYRGSEHTTPQDLRCVHIDEIIEGKDWEHRINAGS